MDFLATCNGNLKPVMTLVGYIVMQYGLEFQ